jgi:hypothetical protein
MRQFGIPLRVPRFAGVKPMTAEQRAQFYATRLALINGMYHNGRRSTERKRRAAPGLVAEMRKAGWKGGTRKGARRFQKRAERHAYAPKQYDRLSDNKPNTITVRDLSTPYVPKAGNTRFDIARAERAETKRARKAARRLESR